MTIGRNHLVVPAGLKVSILADAATRAFRPFGRWPRVIGSLLVLASALGRTYNVYIALALAVLGMSVVETAVS